MHILTALPLLLTLSACSSEPADPAPTQSTNHQSSTDDDASDEWLANSETTKENYEEVMAARARVYERLEYKLVNLQDFSCGDNCYLTIGRRIEGAASEALMCTAPQCGVWQQRGELPAEYRDGRAEVKIGRADQRDAAGTVMNAGVPTIVDIRAITPNGLNETMAKGPLPLRPGVFVEDGIGCANPPNAAFKIWNGEGLSGSSTRACRSTAAKTGEIEWRVENSCENTYDGKRTTETFTTAISGPERFGMNERSFRRCANGSVPDALERLAG